MYAKLVSAWVEMLSEYLKDLRWVHVTKFSLFPPIIIQGVPKKQSRK